MQGLGAVSFQITTTTTISLLVTQPHIEQTLIVECTKPGSLFKDCFNRHSYLSEPLIYALLAVYMRLFNSMAFWLGQLRFL